MKFLQLTNVFNLKNKILAELINCLISAIIMVALTLFVALLNIPNPNLVLFTGLVVITSFFGFIPGVIPVITILVYSIWFFSTNHDFMTFTTANSQKIVVAVITAVISYAFVGLINMFYRRSTNKILMDNAGLNSDNQKLREISERDSLTETKNRYSLRIDFNSYMEHKVYLLIFDIDNFKDLNDTYGHGCGDEALVKVGNVAMEVFGSDSVYRLGGDEFIIIKKDPENFDKSVDTFKHKIRHMEFEGNQIEMTISGGYTHAVPNDEHDLRAMLKFADDLLYEVKRKGKNDIIKKGFVIDVR